MPSRASRCSSYRAEPLESRVLLAKAVAYFPDWEYTGGLLNKIDLSAITHLNYFSIVPGTNGSIPATSASGHSFANMDVVVAAAHARGVSVSIVIGGAGLDHTMMPIAQSPSATTAFVNNLKSFCAAHSLDGVDLDWEPGWGTATVAQITAYGNLINAIKTGAPELLLTAAVNPIAVPTDSGNRYVVPTNAVNSLDLINIMAYDFTVPNHSAYNQSITSLVNWYNYAAPSGVTKSKFVLGVPFYAHENSWATYRSYHNMLETFPTTKADPALDNAGGWYFNNRTTIQNKTQYVVTNGYGGVMVWHLGHDHFTANAYDQYSLMPLIKNTLGITTFTSLTAGNLVANGDANANAFSLSFAGNNVSVTLGPTTRVYPLSLVNSITVNGLGSDDTLSFTGPTNKPIAFAGGTGNDTLNVNAGTFTFNADAIGATSNLTVNVAGGASVQFNTTQHLAALNVASGATSVVAPNASSELGISTRSLSITGTGVLDLNDNDMIVDYDGGGASPIGAIEQMIVSHALTSTTAANNPAGNTTLGAMEASDYATVHGGPFDGESPDTSAVLVKYTYHGDANFSGSVNFDDYVRIDIGYNTGLTGWSNGDFNYSGSVNFDDYVLIDVAFNTQGSSLSRPASIPPKTPPPRKPAAVARR